MRTMKVFLKRLYEALPFKKQLFSLIRAAVSLDKSVYEHLHFKGRFTVAVDARRSFSIRHHGFELENEIFWRGLRNGWEKVSMNLWIELCGRSPVILDIGANTGIYSLVAKTTNAASKVYAFEPVKRVFEKLKDNISLNGYDIDCIEAAVSDRDGSALIYDTPSEHVYSVTVNRNTNNSGVAVIPTAVRTMKLSSFIEDMRLGRVDLIKIDVETHEPEVLRGLEGYLDQFKPTLLIEILNDEVAEQVERIVEGKGYRYFNIDEEGGIRAVDRITKSDYYNFLLCDGETAAALRLI